MSLDTPTVAVCSSTFSAHPLLRRLLLERYAGARFNDEGRSLQGEGLIEFLDGADKTIVDLERIDESVLSRLPRLRVIAKFGVGLDMLDLGALERHGVHLGWRAGVNSDAVAELTLAFAILLLRGASSASAELRVGRWEPRVGKGLADATVGIVGCGNIGRRVAVLLRSFGAHVLANDIVDQPDFYREHGVTPLPFAELLAASDLITLHVPLNASTRGMLGAAALDRLPRGACVINTARGGIVDELALVARLADGRLGGAALDVFEAEPSAHAALLALPNFFGTPHMAGATLASVVAMGRAAIEGLDQNRPASWYR